MAMSSWNWASVANKQFVAANPAIKTLIEQIKFPLASWSAWEFNINKNGASSANINRMADEWITQNKAMFDDWVAKARGGV